MSKLVVGSATDVGLVRSNNQDQLLVSPRLVRSGRRHGGPRGRGSGVTDSGPALTCGLRGQRPALGQLPSPMRPRLPTALSGSRPDQPGNVRDGDDTGCPSGSRTGRRHQWAGRWCTSGTHGSTCCGTGLCEQLTVDHSLVQELVDDGQISQAQAAVHPQRHVLTRALGVEPAADVDLHRPEPQRTATGTCCAATGCSREASDDQIAAVLRASPTRARPPESSWPLAKSRGGQRQHNGGRRRRAGERRQPGRHDRRH